MKFVSIDIETTGLDPKVHSTLEVAMVIEDTAAPHVPVEDLPSFRAVWWPTEKELNAVNWNLYCVGQHRELLDEIKAITPPSATTLYATDHSLIVDGMQKFLAEHLGEGEKVTWAGKNIWSLDIPFLMEMPGFSEKIEFHRRSLDPAGFFSRLTDTVLPNLTECLERQGLTPSGLHTALGDARDVVRLTRGFYGECT